MLRKCSSVLLLTKDEDIAYRYAEWAGLLGVELSHEYDWNRMFRVGDDKVIADECFLGKINPMYLDRVTLIVSDTESFIENEYWDSVDSFIFRPVSSDGTIVNSLYMQVGRLIHSSSADYRKIIEDSSVTLFKYGDYHFDFSEGRFLYKRNEMYLNNSEKKYLAEWLLHGNKDNSKRKILCNLRKKFGKGFLWDIDRTGKPKELKK